MTVQASLNEKRKALHIEDVICVSCGIEAAGGADRVCQLCKALGKTSVPENGSVSLRDVLLATELGRELLIWLKAPRPQQVRK